jgi:hypothetical protein
MMVHIKFLKIGGTEVGAYEAVNDNAYLQDQFITVKIFILFIRLKLIFFRPSKSVGLSLSRSGSCPVPCLLPKPLGKEKKQNKID